MTAPWLTAFLDLPAPHFDRTVRFWSQVTGYAVSPPRGEHDEFASLLPADADPHLKVQRLAEGGPRIHLDVHVADPAGAAAAAEELGAERVADLGYVVMRSPGGLTFCLVPHPGSRRAAPSVWPSGRSMVDQVTLDAPPAVYDRECDFWAALLGVDWRPSPTHTEFRRIELAGRPLGVLLQRLAEGTGEVRAHFDLAADDRHLEVRRHLGLGARVEEEHLPWSVLRDPAGSAYCITGRAPG